MAPLALTMTNMKRYCQFHKLFDFADLTCAFGTDTARYLPPLIEDLKKKNIIEEVSPMNYRVIRLKAR